MYETIFGNTKCNQCGEATPLPGDHKCKPSYMELKADLQTDKDLIHHADNKHAELQDRITELEAENRELRAELAKHKTKSAKAMMVASQGLYLDDIADYHNDLWEIIEELATPEQLQMGSNDYRELYDHLKLTLSEKDRPSIKPDKRCDGCGITPPSRCTEGDCPVFLEIKDEVKKEPTFLPDCKWRRPCGTCYDLGSINRGGACSKNCKFPEPKKDEANNGKETSNPYLL